jgi:Uri superfamily endonuclease
VAGGQVLEPTSPRLTAAPGTYGLILTLAHPTRCTIGALGEHTLPPGPYVYAGSAWGPGGLKARVGRHLRGDGAVRWHIDYLRRHADPVAVWLAPEAHLECEWAAALAATPGAEIVVPRFGASDCSCAAHLFHFATGDPTALALPGEPHLLKVCASPQDEAGTAPSD